MENSVLQLLANDSFIIVNKRLIKELGVECAIMVGELVSLCLYWEKVDKLDEDGWFFATVEDIEERTGLSKHIQNKAIKKLIDVGILEKELRGLHAKRFVRLNLLRLEKITTLCKQDGQKLAKKMVNNYPSRWSKFSQVDGQNLASKNKNIRISNKNKEKSIPNGIEKKKTPASQKFTPPDISQAEEYMQEVVSKKGYNIDAEENAEAFVDFYESKNWMIGKNKMVSWKSAASGWLRRKHNDTNRSREPTRKKDIFAKSGTDYSRFDWKDDS